MIIPAGLVTTADPGGQALTPAAQIVVIGKAPVPGRVKTRLTPPFSPRQAAQLAAAALADTLVHLLEGDVAPAVRSSCLKRVSSASARLRGASRDDLSSRTLSASPKSSRIFKTAAARGK